MEVHFSTGSATSSLAWWNVVQGTSTIALGVLTYLIGRRQASNADYKTRLDLYEKRYSLYREVSDMINETTQFRRDANEVERRIHSLLPDFSFIFNADVMDSMNEVWGAAATFAVDYDFAFQETVRVLGPDPAAHPLYKPQMRLYTTHSANAVRLAMAKLQQSLMTYLDFRTVGSDRPNRVISSALKRFGAAWVDYVSERETGSR